VIFEKKPVAAVTVV